jgi:hypothetical protein
VIDRSALFQVYNHARKAANAGKLSITSVNGALSELQTREPNPHRTTLKSCDCLGRIYRPNTPCRHMIALMIEYRMNQKITLSLSMTDIGKKGDL